MFQPLWSPHSNRVTPPPPKGCALEPGTSCLPASSQQLAPLLPTMVYLIATPACPPWGNLSSLPMKNPQDAGWTCSQSLCLSTVTIVKLGSMPTSSGGLGWREIPEGTKIRRGWLRPQPRAGLRIVAEGRVTWVTGLGSRASTVSPGCLSLSEHCPAIK